MHRHDRVLAPQAARLSSRQATGAGSKLGRWMASIRRSESTFPAASGDQDYDARGQGGCKHQLPHTMSLKEQCMGSFVAAVCQCGDSASAAKRDKCHTVETAGRRRDLIPDFKMGMHLTHQHRLVAHTLSLLLSDGLLPKVGSTAPWSLCTYVPSIPASGPSCLPLDSSETGQGGNVRCYEA